MGINAGINLFIYRYSNDTIYTLIENVIRAVEKNIDLREKVEESYNRTIKLKQKYHIIQ